MLLIRKFAAIGAAAGFLASWSTACPLLAEEKKDAPDKAKPFLHVLTKRA